MLRKALAALLLALVCLSGFASANRLFLSTEEFVAQHSGPVRSLQGAAMVTAYATAYAKPTAYATGYGRRLSSYAAATSYAKPTAYATSYGRRLSSYGAMATSYSKPTAYATAYGR